MECRNKENFQAQAAASCVIQAMDV